MRVIWRPAYRTQISRWRPVTVLACAMWCLVGLGAAEGRALTLDPDFGAGGRVVHNIGTAPRGVNGANSVAVQADGKVVVGGNNSRDRYGDISSALVVRYLQDGSLDPSFGEEGIVHLPGHYVNDVAVQSDGRIIVAGNQKVIRLLPDGSMDETYGEGGVAETGLYIVIDLVLQSDDKVVIGWIGEGQDAQTNFRLARFTTGGSLDTTFGSGGYASADLPLNVQSRGVAVGPDDEIATVGLTYGTSANSDIAIALFDSGGSLDRSFSDDGIARQDLGGYEEATTVEIDATGRILAAGDHWIARIARDGWLDESFAGDGEARTEIGIADLGIQSDGAIVAAGQDRANFGVVRFTEAGVGTGRASVDFGGDLIGFRFRDMPAELAVAPGDRVVVAGSTGARGGSIAVTRLQPDLALDATFSGDGRVTTDAGPREASDDHLHAAVRLNDGRLVVGGSTDAGDGDSDFLLVGLLDDGSLDRSFGEEGIVVTDLGRDEEVRDLTVDEGGRILAVGEAGGETLDIAMARYGPNGSLDTAFANDGTYVHPNARLWEGAHAVALDKAGRIVVCGPSYRAEDEYSQPLENSNLAMWRFTADGDPDRSFGSGGVVKRGIGTRNYPDDHATDVKISTDGKILLLGEIGAAYEPGSYGAGLLRFDGGGDLDRSFGEQGLVELPAGYGTALELQRDGRLLTAGSRGVVRLLRDGAPDASFADDGELEIAGVWSEVRQRRDGNIVLFGATERDPYQEEPGQDLLAALIGPGGAPRPYFGNGGVATVDLGAGDVASAGVLGPGGTATLVGDSGSRRDLETYWNLDAALVRLRIPVDRTAPATRITRLRTGARRGRGLFASVAFKARDLGVVRSPLGFMCKLDRGRYRRCSSPQLFRHLRPGSHVIRVRAVDATGNKDRTPAVRRFEIERTGGHA